MTNIPLTPLEQQILRILISHTSFDKPLNNSNLTSHINSIDQYKFITNTSIIKGVRKIISAGFPICTRFGGYYYALTTEQVDRYIKKINKKVDKYLELVKDLKDSYPNVGRSVGAGGSIIHKVRLAVKTETGSVQIRDFVCDPEGKPIIPEGVDVIK